MSLASLWSARNSLMSNRRNESFCPKTNSAIDLASSVLPTPVGPAKNSTPCGRALELFDSAPVSPMHDLMRMSTALRIAAG